MSVFILCNEGTNFYTRSIRIIHEPIFMEMSLPFYTLRFITDTKKRPNKHFKVRTQRCDKKYP